MPVREHKSNYSRVGGYTPEIGAPNLFATWVFERLQEANPPSVVAAIAEPEPPRPYRVLELGCASGHAVREMRALGMEAFGVDISEYIPGLAPEDVRAFVALGDMRGLGATSSSRPSSPSTRW